MTASAVFRNSDKPDVDQVEANHQQMIHTVCQLRVSVKAFDQKDPAILMQSARDPDGHGHGEDEVEGVVDDGFVQVLVLFVRLD